MDRLPSLKEVIVLGAISPQKYPEHSYFRGDGVGRNDSIVTANRLIILLSERSRNGLNILIS